MSLRFESLFLGAVGEPVDTLPEWGKVRRNVPGIVRDPEYGGAMVSWLSFAGRVGTGGERCEAQALRSDAVMGQESWYGFAVYLPENFEPDSIWELVAQWFPYADDDAEWGRQPALALHTEGGRWTLTGKHSPEVSTPINHASIRSYSVWSAPYQRGRWTEFVVHVKWTHQRDGFCNLWVNGDRAAHYAGPTCYNDARGPFLKMGLYKGWQQANRTDAVDERAAWIAQVRVGNADSSYSEVAPRRITAPVPEPEPEPAPQPVALVLAIDGQTYRIAAERLP